MQSLKRLTMQPIRPPTFAFAFDAGLFPFQFHKPAFVSLFQFPPTSKSRQIRIAYPSIEYSFFALRYARIMTGEVSPVTPLKEVCNKDDRRRSRSRSTRDCTRSKPTNPRTCRCTNTRRRAKLYRSTNNKHNPQNKSRTIRL